jgi:hypothetical protein
MALRRFIDSEGRTWEAWHVRPPHAYAPVRSGVDRRATGDGEAEQERRRGPDRRTQPLSPELAVRWVCFETPGEKRRLVPAPPECDECPDTALERFCRDARAVR